MNEPPPRLAWPPFIGELSALTKTIPNAPSLYLVGGAVRDAYLRRPIDDIDVAVAGDAIAAARYVTDALNADIYIMDRERDVARVFVQRDEGAVTIDFARLRGATLDADLRDRDFTMNAMAADLLGDPGVLIDPLDGVADLRTRVLRRCSPRSIANDPIRMLRAVRFCAQFELKMRPDLVRDIRQTLPALRQASPERVRDEFFKLLGTEKAARGLRVLARMGILEMILPFGVDCATVSLAAVERMSAILAAISRRRTDNTAAAFDLGMLVIQWDRYRAALQSHLAQVYGNGRARGELLILAALLHALGEAKEGESPAAELAQTAAEALRLSRSEARNLSLTLSNCGLIIERQDWTTLDQHRFWHRLDANGIDAILLGAAVRLARAGAMLRQADWLKFVERATILLDAFFSRYDEIVNPALYLDGNDVCDLLNIGGGPRIGRMLSGLREAQVSGEVASVAQARAFVGRMAD